MKIPTIEENFDYQMKKVIAKFKEDFELEELTAEEFQEEVWEDERLCAEFGRAVMETCNYYSGDELFE